MFLTEENFLKTENQNFINYSIIFLLITALFVVYGNINNGYFTDGYVNLRISKDFTLFFTEKGSPVFNENPVYPLLISFFSFFTYEFNAALIVNYSAYLLGAVFFYKICFFFVKRSSASICATVFFILNPVGLFWALRVMPDTLFVTLCLFFFYLILKEKFIYGAIILFILSVTRTEGIFLLPVLFFYSKEKSMKKSLFLCFLVILPFILKAIFFKSGGSVNFIIAYDMLVHVDLLSNIKNHLSQFPYVFGLSTMVFILSGILFYFKFEKKQKEIYAVIYIIVIYLLMNFFWAYVQFRHWLPFIWAVHVLTVYFFKKLFEMFEMNEQIETGRKTMISVILMLFIAYTAYGNYYSAINRVDAMKDIMGNIKKSGYFIRDKKNIVVFSNVSENLSYFSPEKNFYSIYDFESLYQNIDNDIYYVIYSEKVPDDIPWENILEEEIKFESEFNFHYPAAPVFGFSSSWLWLEKKGEKIKNNTTIYSLKKNNFLQLYAQNMFVSGEYEKAIEAVEKILESPLSDSDRKIIEDGLKIIKIEAGYEK